MQPSRPIVATDESTWRMLAVDRQIHRRFGMKRDKYRTRSVGLFAVRLNPVTVLTLACLFLLSPANSRWAELYNIALNPTGTGFPSPLESDAGWGGGGGSLGGGPWQMLDGVINPPVWMHGLAFTGGAGNYMEPAGWRKATIDFGSMKEFEEVVIWSPPREMSHWNHGLTTGMAHAGIL